MRVVYLGKPRYQLRPDFQSLVDVGAKRGHELTLLDRTELLGSTLCGVDLVLAKSHYKDGAVRAHLRRVGPPVINALEATAVCASRRQVALRLVESGVPTPGFLALDQSGDAFSGPCVAKPDLGGDHQLSLLARIPSNPDPAFFYQQWRPTSKVWKVYTIGARHWQVELSYSSRTALADPERSPSELASSRLAKAANAVAESLGLEVFNTDFIDHEGQLLAIDVNPFPGLSTLHGAAEALWSVAEKRIGSGDPSPLGFIRPCSPRGFGRRRRPWSTAPECFPMDL